MRGAGAPGGDGALIDECRARAIALLRRNLTPAGILAATPSSAAQARAYTAVFARDAAVCALGMATSGEADLERDAVVGLLTLARHQAPNGQLPKFVDASRNEADFWYLGCIDATLWWLLAVDFLDRHPAHRGLRASLSREIERALHWLACQEHQRFHLLQQNEASDWADIMPRSGFVLYSNALWYAVKLAYGVAGATQTRLACNQLFHPFSGEIAPYRRARLLVHYVRNRARNRDLYLSFVNFSFWGEEGDVFGNLLACLLGLADGARARAILRAIEAAGVHHPYPIRVVCEPILEQDLLWRPYMSRHRQNFAWQYHNGGIWPFVGAFWVMALARSRRRTDAEQALAAVARANAAGGWAFCEWFNGRTFEPGGMRGQSWNAGAFLLAQHLFAQGPAAKLWSAPLRPSPLAGEGSR